MGGSINEHQDNEHQKRTSSDNTSNIRNRDYKQCENTENLPSVYINSELLSVNNVTLKYKKEQTVYEIGGKIFEVRNERDAFEEFKLYAQRIGEEDECRSTSPESLEVQERLVDIGFVINSSVLLTFDQYHTLAAVFEDCLNCFVCESIVMLQEREDHIASENHIYQLGLHPPLAQFRFSIARKRENHFHCGVCNVVFHEGSCAEHFKGKPHEDNFKTATELSAKYTQTPKERKQTKDIQHTDRKDAGVCNVVIHEESCTEHFKGKPHEDNFKTATELSAKYTQLPKERKQTKDIQHTDSATIKDAINDRDNVNVTNLDSVVSVRTGKVVFQVKLSTWHMVSVSKCVNNKTFHCMACKETGDRARLAEHVASMKHLQLLETFRINGHYGEHLIREDDKWAHCSTCNNLHFIGGTDIHIGQHKKKTLTYADSVRTGSDVGNASCVTDVNEKTAKTEVGSKAGAAAVPKGYPIICMSNAVVSEQCFVFLFGFKIRVSLLSLNLLFRNAAGFYCALCKVNFFVQNIHDHIRSELHTFILNSVPALQHFGYNYIRSVHNLPHCGICHLIIQPDVLLLHLQDPTHVMQTNIALGLAEPIPPVARVLPTVQNVKSDHQSRINEASAIKDVQSGKEKVEKSGDDNRSQRKRVTEEKSDKISITDNENDERVNEGKSDKASITDNENDERVNEGKSDKASITDNENDERDAEDKSDKASITDSVNVKSATNLYAVVKNASQHKRATDRVNEEKSDHASITGFNLYAEVNERVVGYLSEGDVVSQVVAVPLRRSCSFVPWPAYNALAPAGDGAWLCALCGRAVPRGSARTHVRAPAHARALSTTHFLEEYEGALIRQICNLYHCAVCNVILRRCDLKEHLKWTGHVERRQASETKLTKSERRAAGRENRIFPTQKEVCSNEDDREIKVQCFTVISRERRNIKKKCKKIM